MVQGVVIPARLDEPATINEFEGLEDYQGAVGGYIEPVELALSEATLFVNEEGRLRDLDFNPRATFLWWYLQPTARGTTQLVGDVVVVGRSHKAGRQIDISADLAESLTKTGVYMLRTRRRDDSEWLGTGITFDSYFDALFRAMVIEETTRGVVEVVRRSADSPSVIG